MNAAYQKVSAFVNRVEHPLLWLIIIGLVIRLILAPLLTFNIDMGYWTQIVDLIQNGFGLYGTEGYYYTPIWGYIIGADSLLLDLFHVTDYGTFVEEFIPLINEEFKINAFVTSIGFNTIIKIPLIFVDLAVGALIYRIVMRFTNDKTKSILAFTLWFFCPLVITESSVHGMFDNVSVLMILLSIMLAYDRQYFFGGMAFSAAVLTKFFPLFLIFFLVAIVLKHEGTGKEGIRCLSQAIVGAVVAFVLIYIPNIINGDFWLSTYFLAYRIGITRETLANIGLTETVIIVIAAVIVIGLILLVINKLLPKLLESKDVKNTDRNVRRALLIFAAVAIVAYAAYSLIRTTGNNMDFEQGGLSIVTLIMIFSVFMELYLAYRMLIANDFDNKKFITFMFLTALAVILWPCAPSYILIAFPFIIIYAVVCSEKYIKPFIITSILFTLMEITAFMLSFTSLAVATGFIDISIIKGIMEFLAGSIIGPLNGSDLLTMIFGMIAYISLLYISYKWYRNYYRGVRHG